MSLSATGVPTSSGMAVMAAESPVDEATSAVTFAFFSSSVSMVAA